MILCSPLFFLSDFQLVGFFSFFFNPFFFLRLPALLLSPLTFFFFCLISIRLSIFLWLVFPPPFILYPFLILEVRVKENTGNMQTRFYVSFHPFIHSLAPLACVFIHSATWQPWELCCVRYPSIHFAHTNDNIGMWEHAYQRGVGRKTAVTHFPGGSR